MDNPVRTLALRCIPSLRRRCKQNLSVRVGFFLCLYLGSLLFSETGNAGRTLTLHWDKDVFVEDDGAEANAQVRTGLGEVIFAPARLPCFFVARPFTLAFYTLQIGTSCAVRTGQNHAVAVDLAPEIAVRKGQNLSTLIRPALKGGLTQSLSLGDGLAGSMVFGSIHYKFTPKGARGESGENVEQGFSAFQFQKWNDLFDSVLSVGWLTRSYAPFAEAQQESYSIRYYESLPLELRRIGGLENSSSVSFKAIEASARFREGSWVLGGGIGYLVLSIDNIRLGLPYPELTVAYEW